MLSWPTQVLRALLPAVAAGMLACGDDGGPDCASLEEPPTVTVGSGYTSFQPLASGDTLEVYPLPEGGHIVYTGLEARGFYPGDQDEIKRFYEGPVVVDFDSSPTAGYTIRSPEKDLGTENRKLPLLSGQRFGDVVRLTGTLSHEEGLALEATVGSISLTLTDVCGNEQSTTVDVVFDVRWNE